MKWCNYIVCLAEGGLSSSIDIYHISIISDDIIDIQYRPIYQILEFFCSLISVSASAPGIHIHPGCSFNDFLNEKLKDNFLMCKVGTEFVRPMVHALKQAYVTFYDQPQEAIIG